MIFSLLMSLFSSLFYYFCKNGVQPLSTPLQSQIVVFPYWGSAKNWDQLRTGCCKIMRRWVAGGKTIQQLEPPNASAHSHPPAHPHRHFTCCCKALIILLRGISLLYLSRYFPCTPDAPEGDLSWVVCLFFPTFLVPSHLLSVGANAVV